MGWLIWKTRRRPIGRSRRRMCCEWLERTWIWPIGPKEWCGVAGSDRQPAADHIDSFPHVRRSAGHDVHQTYAYGRGAVEHDVALQAEQRDGNLAGTLAGHGRSQAGHANGPG